MTKLRYSFSGVVTGVREHSRLRRAYKRGDEIVTEREPIQWFIQIGDISFRLDEEPPPGLVGRPTTIIIEIQNSTVPEES